MGKVATSITEQLDLLSKRGMVIKEREKASEYLLDIGYYRMGFYWHYFEIDGNHNFKGGIDIETVRELYYLDFDLKYLLAKYIYRIEVHFRSQLVRIVSNMHKESPTWFMDSNIVNSAMVKVVKTLYYGNDEYFKKNNLVIKKHHDKYINDMYAPAWKTLEFFTFGQINKLFRNLVDNNLKLEIASIYGYRNLRAFENHISAIVHIRNICSHNGILFDFNQPKGIMKIPNRNFRLKSRNQTNLNASIRLILSVLNNISVNRTTELKDALKSIMDTARKNVELEKIIFRKIGYDIF